MEFQTKLSRRSRMPCSGVLQGSSTIVNLGQTSDELFEQGKSLATFLAQSNSDEPMDAYDLDDMEGADNYGKGEDDDCGMDDNMPSMDLTDDLLHMVFSFLDQRSLCEAAMVCRQWRTASAHEDFWKLLNFEGIKFTQEKVGWLCRRYPKAVELSLTHVPCVDEIAREAMYSLRCLEVLILCKGHLTDSFFNALTTGCLALQHLMLTDAVLGSGGSQEIQICHETLRGLRVTECRVMRIAVRCPLLEELSLQHTSMASALLQCPRLLSLDVSSCHKLSDAGVRAAATACPSLVALDISQCSYVSDETLREISIACSNLNVLDASQCPNISFEGVRMPMLRDLKLHNCEGINSSSMAALSQCFMLETIKLDFCALLNAVVLDLQRLQNISLVNCRKFADLTLRCPSLVDVNVTTCPVLNRIEIASLALERLVLQKQQSLTTMSLQCPHLGMVDLTECDSLTNSICEVFSEGGGCPRLSSLTLDSCESLTMVNLSSTSLKVLSLAGCRKISSINLSCANLQVLNLDGCDHLTTATFAPVGLQTLDLGICPRVTQLKIEASCMTKLDLKGCGALYQASIYCPKLLSLDAFYCSRLEDECLDATTRSCPLIQSLILASCPSIGPAGLSALKNLHNLTTLDLSYTFLTDLTPIFETCPGLKVLKLLACKYLVDTALDALHWKKALPELRELDLSYGSLCQMALEGLLSQCPHLTHVSFNGCVNLYDLDWESNPPLELCDLGLRSTEGDFLLQLNEFCAQDFQSQEKGLSSSKLEEIGLITGPDFQCDILNCVTNSPSYIREINDGADCRVMLEQAGSVNRASRLQDIMSTRALQHLNCVGCLNIKKVVIPNAAGFHELSSLNLSLSNNIREVRLECFYLMSLNLSNCTALEELDIRCPRLVSLSLQASGIEGLMLEGALEGCRALETLDVRNCAKVTFEAVVRMRAACPRLKRLLNTISA